MQSICSSRERSNASHTFWMFYVYFNFSVPMMEVLSKYDLSINIYIISYLHLTTSYLHHLGCSNDYLHRLNAHTDNVTHLTTSYLHHSGCSNGYLHRLKAHALTVTHLTTSYLHHSGCSNGYLHRLNAHALTVTHFTQVTYTTLLTSLLISNHF